MLRAGIDIGTNTILLLIAEVKSGQVDRVLEDHVTVVRLGQGVDKNRAFHPDALERARKCFRNYADILKKYPSIKVKAAATSGSRDAKNSTEFFEEIRATYGIPIEVISGEEEARYSFIGSVPDDVGNYAVLDIGGGSTEIVGKAGSGLFRHSFDLGCVRMTERFLKSDPVKPEELAALKSYVVKELQEKSEVLKQAGNKELIAVAGTATYLASSFLGLKKFDPEKVHMTELSLKDIESLTEKFIPLTAKERVGMGGMDPGRADVIVGGAVILREVLKACGLKRVRVSVRGLRYGLVLS
jgi:exopolyphosphatase/guanosine-5'-triphosphate,3'-diphosphate pyrophosphatase